MRSISCFATAISLRSGLLVLYGTGRRGAWFLPASDVRHRGPGFGGREMAVLQQLDRDAVGRTDKGHMAVARRAVDRHAGVHQVLAGRSEEHTSELQSLMRNSYAVFCLKKKKNNLQHNNTLHDT